MPRKTRVGEKTAWCEQKQNETYGIQQTFFFYNSEESAAYASEGIVNVGHLKKNLYSLQRSCACLCL